MTVTQQGVIVVASEQPEQVIQSLTAMAVANPLAAPAAAARLATALADQIPTTGSGKTVKVNPDNVLQAGKIINEQVESLRTTFDAASRDLIIDAPGGDIVSSEVAAAWNSRLAQADDSYAKRVQQYIDSLDKLCAQMREAAKQYGYTEEDITGSFGAGSA
ncbi:PE domain-containing protein [Goodfellowiella coeruleoviolacea]|uniref:PE family protein n=1 Tax=Goodfellowiella coeruleoviolacea TaxID=334858 RepID=A0AAE3GDL3_9PSEU|nr:PE domain-containing protein [Goodfellowiella coeruleoviolacea]MCP2166180.1 PE family protein [Goodfellowiella coeruleoviolacea]